MNESEVRLSSTFTFLRSVSFCVEGFFAQSEFIEPQAEHLRVHYLLLSQHTDRDAPPKGT